MKTPRTPGRARRPRRGLSVLSTLTLIALLATLLAACGEEDGAASGDGPTPTPPAPTATIPPAPTATTPPPPSPTITADAIIHPTGADDVVLRITVTGGFVPPNVIVTTLPAFVLTGDGKLISPGPVIAIYPGPALPNLLQTRLTEEGVQAILREAELAGLLDGDADYGFGGIADAPTTYFVVDAGGQVSNVSAYALGMDTPDPQATPEVTEARQKLADFQAKLADLSSWIPANDILATDEAYQMTNLQVVAQNADAAGDSGDASITPQEKDWPLSTPLAEFGAPFFMDQSRCGAVTGTDLTTLLTALSDANQITRWTSDEQQYVLFIRPLFGDEVSCPQPGA